MSPKEKAKELVGKFMKYSSHYPSGDYLIQKGNAKQCALIVVDEIMRFTVMDKMFDEHDDDTQEYWLKVKEEI